MLRKPQRTFSIEANQFSSTFKWIKITLTLTFLSGKKLLRLFLKLVEEL